MPEQTKPTPMTDAAKARVNAIFSESYDRIAYMAMRWRDECQYEPWAEYVTALKGLLPDDVVFTNATKRPFGVSFWCQDAIVWMGVKGKYVEWKRIG